MESIILSLSISKKVRRFLFFVSDSIDILTSETESVTLVSDDDAMTLLVSDSSEISASVTELVPLVSVDDSLSILVQYFIVNIAS